MTINNPNEYNDADFWMARVRFNDAVSDLFNAGASHSDFEDLIAIALKYVSGHEVPVNLG